jgi:hypothetical protein
MLLPAVLDSQEFPALPQAEDRREPFWLHRRRPEPARLLAAELDREALAATAATSCDDLTTAAGGHAGTEAVRTGAADVVGLIGALHRDVPWVTRRLRRLGSGNCPGRAPVNKGPDRYQRTLLLSNASPPGGPSAALRSLSCPPQLRLGRPLSTLDLPARPRFSTPPQNLARCLRQRGICSVPPRRCAGSATGLAARPDFHCDPRVGSTSQLARPDPRKVACLESRFTTLPHSTGLRSAQGTCQARPGSRGRSIPRRSRAPSAPILQQSSSLTLSLPSSLAPRPGARVKEPSRVAPRRPERLNLSDRSVRTLRPDNRSTVTPRPDS